MDERSRGSVVCRVVVGAFVALLVTSAPVAPTGAGPADPHGDFWCRITPACVPPVD